MAILILRRGESDFTLSPLFSSFTLHLHSPMKPQRQSLVIFLLVLSLYSAILQLIRPAPRRMEICGSSRCVGQGLDTYFVYAEDYFGYVVTVAVPVMAAGLLATAIGVFKKKKFPTMLGISIAAVAIVHAFFWRQFAPFGSWPTAMWIGLVAVLLVSGSLLAVDLVTVQTSRRAAS